MRLYDYGASANCYKARLVLAQLGLPYERVPIDIFGGDTLTDEFAAKNPARSTPVLETDDGRYLQESNAIIWYLAQGTAFLPEDEFDRAHVLKWLILEQTDVMPGIGGLPLPPLTGPWAPRRAAARARSRRARDARGAFERAPVSRRRAVHDRRHRGLRVHAHGAGRRFRPRRLPRGRRLAPKSRAATAVHERSAAVSGERA